MKAETAFNVIQALSEEEKKRLFVMLGVVKPSSPSPKRKTKMISDAEATEYLLKKLNGFRDKRNQETK